MGAAVSTFPAFVLALVFLASAVVIWVAGVELSRFTDDLANTSREYLSRWTELEPTARDAIGSALAARVGAVIAPLPPAPMSPPAYLSAVLAERRRRELAKMATDRPNLGVYAPQTPGTYGPAGPFGRPSVYGNPSNPGTPPYGAQPQPAPYAGRPGQYGVPPRQ